MKPSAIYRMNGEKIPVYYEPVLNSDLSQIMIENRGIFAIKSDKGKLKFYNSNNNLPKMFKFFDFDDISFFSIVKMFGTGILAYYSYKVISFRPKNPFGNSKKSMKDLREELDRVESPEPPTTHSKGEDNISSSPNGWTISNIN